MALLSLGDSPPVFISTVRVPIPPFAAFFFSFSDDNCTRVVVDVGRAPFPFPFPFALTVLREVVGRAIRSIAEPCPEAFEATCISGVGDGVLVDPFAGGRGDFDFFLLRLERVPEVILRRPCH